MFGYNQKDGNNQDTKEMLKLRYEEKEPLYTVGGGGCELLWKTWRFLKNFKLDFLLESGG